MTLLFSVNLGLAWGQGGAAPATTSLLALLGVG